MRRATSPSIFFFILLQNFYPRSPCGERPAGAVSYLLSCLISIHALLAESDTVVSKHDVEVSGFLSTLSLRRATTPKIMINGEASNFYPRSPCGERPFEKFEGVIATKISIHALLAESDNKSRDSITIRPTFLSTLSLRRATVRLPPQTMTKPVFLSTLSLRRATLLLIVRERARVISIHALLAESDCLACFPGIG